MKVLVEVTLLDGDKYVHKIANHNLLAEYIHHQFSSHEFGRILDDNPGRTVWVPKSSILKIVLSKAEEG